MKTAELVRACEADVNNGGFDQYYFNSAGNHATDAAEAFERIGASAMAETIRAANALFGEDGPPVDRDARQAALEELDESLFEPLDQRFFAYPDDVEALLAAFVDET